MSNAGVVRRSARQIAQPAAQTADDPEAEQAQNEQGKRCRLGHAGGFRGSRGDIERVGSGAVQTDGVAEVARAAGEVGKAFAKISVIEDGVCKVLAIAEYDRVGARREIGDGHGDIAATDASADGVRGRTALEAGIVGLDRRGAIRIATARENISGRVKYGQEGINAAGVEDVAQAICAATEAKGLQRDV